MVNKVILIGNLGKDPVIRHTPSGAPVASFTLATSERFKDASGERQERTEWHNIIVWRQLAELAEKYLKKGSRIYLEGKITYRTYEAPEGGTRYITEIVGFNMNFLSPKSDGSSGGYGAVPLPPDEGYGSGKSHEASAAEEPGGYSGSTSAQKPTANQQAAEEEDDLPF